MKRNLHISMISSLVLFLSAASVLAADLPTKDAKILEEAGITIYEGAEYVNGQLGGMTGLRFASSTALAEVRAFYRSEFPSWALNSEYGSWILYNGEPGGGPAAYMEKQQIMVAENENLSEWFGVDKSKTTEIIIVVPK